MLFRKAKQIRQPLGEESKMLEGRGIQPVGRDAQGLDLGCLPTPMDLGLAGEVGSGSLFPRPSSCLLHSSSLECKQPRALFFCLLCMACGILVSRPGIEPTLPHWNHGVLTTGPPGKSPRALHVNIL